MFEKLIKQIEDHIGYSDVYDDIDHGYNSGLSRAIKHIEEYDPWISVEDGHPPITTVEKYYRDSSDHVLIKTSFNNYFVAIYQRYNDEDDDDTPTWRCGDWILYNVVAWMPISK
jgi:hypothetical protein